ncbi:1,4-dihydroxy-2-naphthoate polyprenyltransferase [Heyndrickxia acidiproducens]|uniref:1,4-dihydroxy-2-naphthoate polyprenyltransferase n=1 Tax=Heyndrickxia acidiproducens TaxID=1121084 RepID=UPI00037CF4A3|nr:1,4-dihydroxy-2-naphthoate polyprenyltransferase [Heyndrickxia acidiproducens]
MGMQSSPAVHPDKGWRVWWQLTRPHTLTAGFVPVILGTVLALGEARIHIPLFVAMLVATLLIQAATNMFNEYYDFKRGLDNEQSVGIGGAIVRNGVHPKTVLHLALAFFGAAILIGVYISASSSWWVAITGSVCMLVAYLYTAGPVPIASTPLGELISGFFMGVIIILISFFIQTDTITWPIVFVSIPIMILIGAIMLSNNIRDLDGDKANGRRTIAILLGRNGAITLLAVMFALSYLWMVCLVFLEVVTPWVLLVLVSTPKPVRAIKGFIGKKEAIQMLPAMKATAQTNTVFGLLLSISFLIDHFI